MRVRYSEWDDNVTREMTLKNLMKLFTHLLTQSSGDVEKALKWMEQLGRRYGFFDKDFTVEDFKEFLKDENYIQENEAATAVTLTSKGEQRIRLDAFEEIFSSLKRDAGGGNHRTNYLGEGGDKLPETREFQFGDMIADIDFTRSIHNAIRNHGLEQFAMEEDDLEVNQREQMTSCATVMLVDISHSMILYGEDRITPAKKVAMALAEFIQSRYPKDSLEVAVFGDDVYQVSTRDLPYISVGPFHTNTKGGLELAQRLLQSKKQVNKQIFMITDGKPSAIFEDGRIYKNSFGLDPKIVNQTINEAVQCRRKGIVITTFMITSDPYLQDFVDRLTKANKGRAYFASLDKLGSFILTDYVRNRKKKI
ncbi:MAG: VWA domain-containing protein [Candidatus Sumerlaeaceae bacterium]|nr:VWA domain-containing protein [Candidatus Sumerlaeaceae bacterium]